MRAPPRHEFRVREAGPADLAAIVEFQCAMARETEDKALDPDLVTRGVRAALEDPARGWYLVATSEDAPIASLLVTFEWSDWRAAWFWWIQSVFVRAEFRGRGVYRALYDEVVSRARSRGDVCGLRLYVEHENAGARAVYERLGMHRAHYEMYEVEF